ncbi:MAG: cell division protein FtsA [Aquificae bacterium]|nr:cell division protein FtsA [Aquificota bacterium]
MGDRRTVIVLDIGTSKIITLVAEVDDNDITIIGYGEEKSQGIEKGTIAHRDKLKKAIVNSIKKAEEYIGGNFPAIKSVYTNIFGVGLESKKASESIEFEEEDRKITKEDVDELYKRVEEKLKTPRSNFEIIHILDQNFILDDGSEVEYPINSIASRIEGHFIVITIPRNVYRNLEDLIRDAGYEIEGMVANPIASAEAVLDQDEKDMGVVVIDMGAGFTDVAVYKNGSLDYITSFPFGGSLITFDIAYVFKLPKSDAEELKKEHGVASVERIRENNYIIDVETREEEIKEITVVELAEVIESRLEDLFSRVKKKLEEDGYKELPKGGIVLTGGEANLPYIREIASRIFKADVRIGKPNRGYFGFGDILNNPKYSTAIGMLLFKKDEYKKYTDISNPLPDFGGLKNKATSWLQKLKNLFH